MILWLVLALAQAGDYPIEVVGSDEASFAFSTSGPVEELEEPYDAVVVGGGLAGLTSALYLRDSGLRVLILEKEPALGGLAAGGERDGIRYCRGAAYWTPAYEEELRLLERIGLGDYKEKYEIHEPIDSYLWNGKLYPGLWEDESVLETLPASFRLFRHELELADKEGLIPNQPMEHAAKKELDHLDARTWIRRMPEKLAQRKDEKSRSIYENFKKDSRIDARDPMRDVLQFLDQFSRSALGVPTSHVSAMAFANFYISEIDVRYASEIGTGIAAEKLVGLLNGSGVDMRTRARVEKIVTSDSAASVEFSEGGRRKRARGSYVVFAAQLSVAAKIIEGLKERSPEQYQLFDDLGYAHFSIHTVWTKGHPYRASYDTWVRAADYSPSDFTDVIAGRWQDPRIHGYEGMRDFSKDPADSMGILTVYNPHLPTWVGAGFTVEAAKNEAKRNTERLLEIFNPVLAAQWGQRIEVEKVETYRWPFSLHMVEPGHLTRKASIMRKPFGRIYFANNNLGTPSFEEALFRGHCAATNIRERLDRRFEKPRWTQCPIE